jgi:signal recognition particle receptor subunit beta
LGSIIIGKVILYYVLELVKKGTDYFSGKPNYKNAVKKVLDSMANNKRVIDDISKMIDSQRGIDSVTADKIVKMGYIQNSIQKVISKDKDDLDKTELENQIKTILSKSWNDLGDKAIDKVKNDLKK